MPKLQAGQERQTGKRRKQEKDIKRKILSIV